jgi:hypothetical protein
MACTIKAVFAKTFLPNGFSLAKKKKEKRKKERGARALIQTVNIKDVIEH